MFHSICRFNTSKNDSLVRQLSRLYEHYFVRLKLNGDILDKQAFESEYREWINSLQADGIGYDVLYLNKIK